jgi:pimeloyl-ACP methyl ester carboxylesterase
VIGAKVLNSFSFRETPPNEILAALDGLDLRLTPNQGLRVLRDGKLEKADGFATNGPTLLLVHGTFSTSDMYLDEFAVTKAQNDFLSRAAGKYEAILAFDHPTLSVSPWINALDLERALEHVTGPIDVICHSRGGLVVAWWLRNSQRNVKKVVFVGSPLEGTSLASPANLRSALNMLANVIKVFETIALGTGAVLPFTAPLMAAVAGLVKIVGGVVQFGASTPLADAAVAIVPGLMGQSRVRNNAELDRLMRVAWVSKPTCYAVTSNFEPGDDAAWWQFWQRFRPTQIMNYGADVIFKEERNDLVVNTLSMTKLACGTQIPQAQILDFGTSRTVHHCNYFRQPQTVDFLAGALQI